MNFKTDGANGDREQPVGIHMRHIIGLKTDRVSAHIIANDVERR